MLRTLTAAALLLSLSTAASAQNASAVVAAASKAMGADNLTSITYSGTARNGAYGQSKSIGNPMGPVNVTQISGYTRTVTFAPAASPTALVLRTSGTTQPPTVPGVPPPMPGQVNQNVTGQQITDNRGQALNVWTTPWGFLKGATARSATNRQERGQQVLSFSPPNIKSPSGQLYTVTGYINNQNQVTKVETRVEHAVVGDLPVEFEYSGYRTMNGVQVPTRIVQKQAGMQTFDAEIKSATPNPSNLTALLTPPPPPAGAPGGGGAALRPADRHRLSGDDDLESLQRLGDAALLAEEHCVFLSENAEFAEICGNCGLNFIGPTPENMRLMGDKISARQTVTAAGVPILPGTKEGVKTPEEAKKIAAKIGYPVIIKATAGGGGRGMRVVRAPAELSNAVKTAQREAEAAFGVGDVYIEKYVEAPRHVEFQILGDQFGNVIHLGERECSIQRRHQKLIEESPSPALTDKMRRRMGGIVIDAAKAVQYTNAGTFEFLMDQDGRFYFMEVNTRLQVEHPVTEMVTGLDLVEWMIRVAAGEKLPLAQKDVKLTGSAIEARVYAEDPARNFLPQAGTALKVRWAAAERVRVDAGVESGDSVPVHYDPILAKVIAAGGSRSEALERLTHALDESLVHGVTTNLPFLRALARARAVQRAEMDTEWIEREFLAGFAALATAPAPELALAAVALDELFGVDGAPRTRAGRRRRSEVYAALGRWRHRGLE